jgi:hypothetical protein
MNHGTYSAECSLDSRYEVAEPTYHLVAHAVVRGDAALLQRAVQAGVEILAICGKRQVELHVVDTGYLVSHAFPRERKIQRQLAGGVRQL